MSKRLFEDKFKRETGKRFTKDLEKIKDAVGKDNFFVHFTDTPKIGINPRSTFLPGLYAYPLTREIYEKFVISVDEYARGQGRAGRYVFLLKIKPDAKIIEGKELEGRIVKNFAYCIAPLLDSNLAIAIPKNRYLGHEEVTELIETHYRDDIMLGLERIRSELKRIEFHINKRSAKLAALKTVLRETAPDAGELPEWINEKLWDGSKESKRNMQKLTLDHITNDELASGKLASAIYTYKDHPMIAGIRNSVFISNDIITLQNLANHSYSGAATKRWDVLRDLFVFDKKLNTTSFIRTKSGERKEMKQIVNECLERTLQIMKISKEKLLQILKQDSVGTNILLGLGDASVLIDTGIGARNTAAGWGGILGDLEAVQAYIKPPIGKSIEVIAMVDRFEGDPDSKTPPGTSTPDKDYGKVADDEWRDWAAGRESGARDLSPRALALNKKFLGKGYQQAKYDRDNRLIRPGKESPTERWKDAKLEMIVRDCIREMIFSKN